MERREDHPPLPRHYGGDWHEQPADEPEVFLCRAGCGTEVEEEGACCGGLCEEILSDEDAGDAKYHRTREDEP